MHRPPGAFRRQVPEGAVERITRRAGRQQALQLGAVETTRDLRRKAGDRGAHAVDGFSIPLIGHTFAAPAV